AFGSIFIDGAPSIVRRSSVSRFSLDAPVLKTWRPDTRATSDATPLPPRCAANHRAAGAPLRTAQFDHYRIIYENNSLIVELLMSTGRCCQVSRAAGR